MDKTNEKKITGIVESGYRQSNRTGVPTANLSLDLARGLPRGLYACHVEFEQQQWDGVLYYGYNSLSGHDCLEVHLFNFSGDLYGKKITVIIGQFMREEKRFDSVEDLRKQIKEDLKNYQRISNSTKSPTTSASAQST